MTIWEAFAMVGIAADAGDTETITIKRNFDAALILRADGRMETYKPRHGPGGEAVETCARFLSSGTLQAVASGIEDAINQLQANPTVNRVVAGVVEATRDDCDDPDCPIHADNPIKPTDFGSDGAPKAKA